MIGPQVASMPSTTSPSAQSARGDAFSALTDRERDVLELVDQGHDNPTIAPMLVLTPKTVRDYVSAIFAKLDVNGRATLIVRAREAGVGVTRPEPADPAVEDSSSLGAGSARPSILPGAASRSPRPASVA